MLMFVQVQLVQAQWSDDPGQSVAVVDTIENQIGSHIINDGDGNYIIGWRDFRYLSAQNIGGEVYAQKFNAEGFEQWTHNGNLISENYRDYGKNLTALVNSGNGSVIAVYSRWEGTTLYDPNLHYVRKFDSGCNFLWGSISLYVFYSGVERETAVTSDHSGGVITVTSYTNDMGFWGKTDIVAQRINSSGERKWGYRIYVCTADENQNYPRVECNSNGYSFIVWEDERTDSNGDIYFQIVDSTGTIQLQNDGVALSSNPNSVGRPGVFITEQNDAIILWYEGTKGLMGQRVTETGTLLWGDNGKVISSVGYPSIVVSDGNGGAFVAYTKYGNNNDKILYVLHLNSDGQSSWQKTVADGVDEYIAPAGVSDGAEGVIFTWYGITKNIYAQRINSAGTFLWDTNGAIICSETQDKDYLSLAPDNLGGAVITWSDYRKGVSNADIYAQHINKNGNLGGTATQVRPGEASGNTVTVYPNPVHDDLYLKLNGLNEGNMTIRLFSADGTPVKEILAGNKKLISIPVSDLKKGIYILEVRNGTMSERVKVVKN